MSNYYVAEMQKHPSLFTKSEFNDLIGVPVFITLDNKNEMDKTELTGEIVEVSLAANDPNLPSEVVFKEKNGGFRTIGIERFTTINKI